MPHSIATPNSSCLVSKDPLELCKDHLSHFHVSHRKVKINEMKLFASKQLAKNTTVYKILDIPWNKDNKYVVWCVFGFGSCIGSVA